MFNTHVNRCYVCKDEVRRGQRYQIVGQHFGHTKCIERRVGILSFLGLLVFVFAVSLAHAEKTFPLGKPIQEQGVLACLEKEAAVNIANTIANGGQAELLVHLYINFRICSRVATTIVYSTKVHQVVLPDKTKLNVYAGIAGNVPLFVVFEWEHIEVRL